MALTMVGVLGIGATAALLLVLRRRLPTALLPVFVPRTPPQDAGEEPIPFDGGYRDHVPPSSADDEPRIVDARATARQRLRALGATLLVLLAACGLLASSALALRIASLMLRLEAEPPMP
jgi:hypothetical protein